MKKLLLILIVSAGAVQGVLSLNSACPIRDSTTIAYSVVDGVGSGSRIWISDFLSWLAASDPSAEAVSLTAQDLRVHCDLSSFLNLRVFINPGGDAYAQLYSLGVEGTDNIKAFVHRGNSSYVGICAGTYLAAHDYIWETMFQGTDYYDFAANPPMSLFPHTVEGSIFDINDDQFGDQSGSKFRVVNVSNGHHMLYYGGSTFGYNGVPDYTNPASPEYDRNVDVLLYYTDFYGHNTVNVPAAWRYGNLLLCSIHPEASNCTDQQDVDCPPQGTLPMARILQNWAWLAMYINEISGASFIIPPVPIAPSFDSTPPHTSYSQKSCYETDSAILFCDDFERDFEHQIAYGLAPQFQRNESDYYYSHPWNTSFITSWNGMHYTAAFEGEGYAVAVPMSILPHYSGIETKDIALRNKCSSGAVSLKFALKGKTVSSGSFSVEVRPLTEQNWSILSSAALNPPLDSWMLVEERIVLPASTEAFRLKFVCSSGSSSDNYCAMDSIRVLCATD